MKRLIQAVCFLLLAGLVFAENSRVLKSDFKKNRMKRVEPDYRRGTPSRDACPIQYPNNANSTLTGLIHRLMDMVWFLL